MGPEKGPCGRRKVTHEVKRVFPGPILVLFNVPDRARSSLCSRIPDRLLETCVFEGVCLSRAEADEIHERQWRAQRPRRYSWASGWGI